MNGNLGYYLQLNRVLNNETLISLYTYTAFIHTRAFFPDRNYENDKPCYDDVCYFCLYALHSLADRILVRSPVQLAYIDFQSFCER